MNGSLNMAGWRNIKGFEGLYQINGKVDIKSLSRLMYNGKTWFKSK